MCWDCDHFVGNVGIQNISARTKYQEVLQNLHFANSTKQGKTYKKYKVRPVIDHLKNHLKQYFQVSLSKVLMSTLQNSKDVPQ